jgi:uroporphyrinogen decarboxylase
MNSRQRVLTALHNAQPDRVPILEFIVDRKVWSRAVPGAMDMADAMDRLDLDGVGCGAYFERIEERPGGFYRDVWGVEYQSGAEEVSHPVRGPITDMADAKAYTPPDPHAPGRLGKLPELVERYKGRRAICFHHRAAFMWAAYLMGIDNLLVAMLAEPELAALVMDKVLAANIAVVRSAIRAGAEVIILGDDYAANNGPMFSPELFRVFIVPRLKAMIDMIHAEGALVIKHSDGNLYPILEDIVACGPDGINPVEPVAGMDLATVKRLVGDRVCITGNIDCGRLLPYGSRDEVFAAVRQAIADAGAGGGYIVTSSNSIHSSCNPENFTAMIEATREYGAYCVTT